MRPVAGEPADYADAAAGPAARVGHHHGGRHGRPAPIWHDKRETARRVRQRIGAIMKWAIAQGHRQDNPAGEAIAAALPRNGAVRKHMAALPHDEVAGALAKVRASAAGASTKLAFEFLVLTAARSREVRLATWDEIDLAAAVWTMPAERMKANREHRVPLCDRAVEILNDARAFSDGSRLVFPSPRRKALSDMTLSKLVKEQGIPAVPHGFRSSFRDWAAERTNHSREVVEAALHTSCRTRSRRRTRARTCSSVGGG